VVGLERDFISTKWATGISHLLIFLMLNNNIATFRLEIQILAKANIPEIDFLELIL
jgi:hypothetical protein